MLSIVILFCDKDFKYLKDVLQQIKNNVEVKYEVVLIDNREKNKQKLDFDLDYKYYSFGYNARQVQGRKKGIELAEGDYIWFVDADDHIRNVDSELEDLQEKGYDIIVFGKYKHDTVYDNLLSVENLYNVGAQLWNKWIKTSLLRTVEEQIPTDIICSTSEDSLLVIGCMKYGHTIFFQPQEIYRYFQLRSDWWPLEITDAKVYRDRIVGYDDIRNLIDKMLTDSEKEKIGWSNNLNGDLWNYIEKLKYCSPKVIPDCVDFIIEYFDRDSIIRAWESMYNDDNWDRDCFVAARDEFIKRFPENENSFRASQTIKYYTLDDEGKEYCYKTDIIEEKIPACISDWSHTVSIVCLVYEGNQKYLKSFLKTLDRVQVKHEVIIVDNRDKKDKDLEFDYKDAVLVKTEKNLGILSGRREGFKKCSGDYIWFVDIDDEVINVTNKDYGDYDIINFNFSDGYQLSFSPSNTIRDKDVCTTETYQNINCMLWNKWIKRDILERAYSLLSDFFCVYSEDVLVVFAALEFAKSVRVLNSKPIYKHTINDTSVTGKKIKTKADVDRLFVGFDGVQNEARHLKLGNLLQKDCFFYLEIAVKADDKIKNYFLQVLFKKFGKEVVCSEINQIYKSLKKFL